ncbi:MAG: hypothetical protein IJD41_03060 [Alphaproteobacteria bacterium]|nr:hypothetical protein [Alphaproteobacteria bacterium]
MPNLNVGLVAAVLGILFCGGANAATITTTTDCPTLDSNCLSWDLIPGYSILESACVCNECPEGYSKDSQYSCRYVGTDDSTTTYQLCSSSNPCRNFNVTLNGQQYCSTGTSGCNPSEGVGGSFLVSKYCSSGSGVGPAGFCAVAGCLSGYIRSDDFLRCVKSGYSCGVGYTGTATGPDNEGCYACTSKPADSIYTTEGSCAWECDVGFYQVGTSTCTRCPNSSAFGFQDSALTSYDFGRTTSGATSKTECYLVPGTYYDRTGTIELTGNCPYVN